MFSHPHNSAAEAVIITSFYKEKMQGQRGSGVGAGGQPCASILVCDFWTAPQGYEVCCGGAGALGRVFPGLGLIWKRVLAWTPFMLSLDHSGFQKEAWARFELRWAIPTGHRTQLSVLL